MSTKIAYILMIELEPFGKGTEIFQHLLALLKTSKDLEVNSKSVTDCRAVRLEKRLQGQLVGASGRRPRSHEFSVMLTCRGLDYFHIFQKVVVKSFKHCYAG